MRRLELRMRPGGSTAVIVLHGELTGPGVPQLLDTVRAALHAGAGRVVLDGADLVCCDPAGIAAIGDAHREAAGAGVELAAADLQPLVVMAVLLSDAADAVPVYDTVPDALGRRSRRTPEYWPVPHRRSPPAAAV